MDEVKDFFSERNYPGDEAIKFFNHYKALNWKIQGKTLILNWKPLVEKWMQNARKWNAATSENPSVIASAAKQTKDLQYLYDSFIDGKNIFKYILPEHFDKLKLQLSDEILQKAWKERINQVSGTNQHSTELLHQAYLTYNPDNELLKKDQPNFIALAKRLAVINHFQNLKEQSK